MISNTTRRRYIALFGLIAAMTANVSISDLNAAEESQPACPWIVQPDEPIFGLGANNAAYEILFDGRTTDTIFYGFTVADRHLAQQLSDRDKIPDLRRDGRSLKTVEREGMTAAYRVSTDSILPRTIYLLTAATAMPELEQIDARIDPARPIAVGLRTRGATDLSGPMPRRTVPGVEILASSSQRPDETVENRSIILSSFDQDFQLCAYQVSWN